MHTFAPCSVRAEEYAECRFHPHPSILPPLMTTPTGSFQVAPIGARAGFRAVSYTCMLPAEMTAEGVYARKLDEYHGMLTGDHRPNIRMYVAAPMHTPHTHTHARTHTHTHYTTITTLLHHDYHQLSRPI